MPQDRLNNEWATMQSRRAPTDDEWRIAMINHRRGTHVNGTVLSHHAFGFFVDLGETVNGLVESPCIMDLRPGEDGYSDDFPAVGTDIEAVVLGIAEHNRQIWLSMRPSDLLATAGNQTQRRTSVAVPNRLAVTVSPESRRPSRILARSGIPNRRDRDLGRRLPRSAVPITVGR